MKAKASKPLPETIPTSSMADIAFLLIIFFMLTITIEVDKTQVVLPKTSLRMEIPKKAAYVSIDAAGQVKVSNGEEISASVPPAEVFAFAAGVVSTDPAKEFVLKADAGVAYRQVDEIIDSLKRAKVRIIYLLSDQKTVTSTG
jgi:biopolymer transport protein ExbD